MDRKNNIVISSLVLVVGLAILNGIVGNPFSDLLLKFFSDSTSGKLTYADEYDEYDDNGNQHTYYGYKYEYKINDRLIKKAESHEGYLKEEFYDITPNNPKSIEIEYVYFLPTISQIKGSGYPSTFWYIVKSIMLKSILYIGVFFYYWQNIKEDVLGLIEDSFNKSNHIPDELNFNWNYQFLSFLFDLVLIFLSIGIFSIPSMLLEGGWLLIGILFLIWGLMVSYYLTKRMKDGVGSILYLVVLAIVIFVLPPASNSPLEKCFTMTFQIAIIKWVFEVILSKLGYKTSYPIVEWIKEKRANR